MPSLGSIYRRRHTWWIKYYDRGRVFRESSGSPHRKDAIALLRKRLGEIDALGHPVVDLNRILVDAHLSALLVHHIILNSPCVRTLKGQIKALLAVLSGLRAVDLTTTRLRMIVQRWQVEGVAPATINKRMSTLRRAYNLGRRATPPTVLLVPAFPRLPEHNAREGFFERGEFLAVLSHIHDDGLRDYVEWAYWTGMRKGEIAKLEWSAFDRETLTLTLPGRITKNKKPRRLALSGPFREIIERRLAARRLDCRLIFHREGRPITEFRKAWRTACRRAGLSGKLFHDLRRTGVCNLRKAGVDRKVAMMISGHRTEAVFERYNIDTDDDLREAAERVAAYVEKLPAEPTVVPLAR